MVEKKPIVHSMLSVSGNSMRTSAGRPLPPKLPAPKRGPHSSPTKLPPVLQNSSSCPVIPLKEKETTNATVKHQQSSHSVVAVSAPHLKTVDQAPLSHPPLPLTPPPFSVSANLSNLKIALSSLASPSSLGPDSHPLVRRQIVIHYSHYRSPFLVVNGVVPWLSIREEYCLLDAFGPNVERHLRRVRVLGGRRVIRTPENCKSFDEKERSSGFMREASFVDGITCLEDLVALEEEAKVKVATTADARKKKTAQTSKAGRGGVASKGSKSRSEDQKVALGPATEMAPSQKKGEPSTAVFASSSKKAASHVVSSALNKAADFFLGLDAYCDFDLNKTDEGWGVELVLIEDPNFSIERTTRSSSACLPRATVGTNALEQSDFKDNNGAKLITAELRKMSASELREGGEAYKKLLEERALEEILFSNM